MTNKHNKPNRSVVFPMASVVDGDELINLSGAACAMGTLDEILRRFVGVSSTQLGVFCFKGS